MYNIEIDNRIHREVDFLHRLDIWRIEEQSSIFNKTARASKYLICEVPLVISLVIGGFLSENLNECILLIAVGIAALISAIKLNTFLWKQKEIRTLIKEIGPHSLSDYEEFVKVNRKISNLIKFSLSLLLMSSTGSAFLTVFSLPVFSSEKRLPLNIWSPLDWKKNAIAYWITYAFVVIGIIISNIAVSLNIIIWYLMLNCSIKYEILGNEFRNMFLSKPAILKNEEENLFLQKLVRLIKTHRKIKLSIDHFKSCFGNLFFAQITTSGIGICTSVYAMAFRTNDETFIQSMFNAVVLLYTIFDIFIVMYLGNELKLASDRLSYCLFKSDWVERSKSCKKYVIILTEVLKQPKEFIIGKLYPLNMKTFTSIVNLAYSMFNILQNLNKNR